MLELTQNMISALNDDSRQRYFLVKLVFLNGTIKYFSTDTINIYDSISSKYILFKGALTKDLEFTKGFNYKDNSVIVSNISVELIFDENLFEFSKTNQLNLSEAYIYFYIEGTNLEDALELYHGIIEVDRVGLDNEIFSFNIKPLDYKYNKLFPPLKIDANTIGMLPINDAEKFIGDLIPVIFGEIKNPGLPVPLYYDNLITRKFAVANHNVSNPVVFADGKEISPSKYITGFENNIFYIKPNAIDINDFSLLANGETVSPSNFDVTSLGNNNFTINVSIPRQGDVIQLYENGSLVNSSKYTISPRDDGLPGFQILKSVDTVTVSLFDNDVEMTAHAQVKFPGSVYKKEYWLGAGGETHVITLKINGTPLTPYILFWQPFYYRWDIEANVPLPSTPNFEVWINGSPLSGSALTITYLGSPTYKYKIVVDYETILTDYNFEVFADVNLIDKKYYTINYNSSLDQYTININGFSNYENWFLDKKITVSCVGLISNNPSISEVVKYILENYTNLPLEKIDSDYINSIYDQLATFKVSRFFNGDSSAFESIKDLMLEFPFVLTDREFKKSIIAVDPNFKDSVLNLETNVNIFDRSKSILLSKPNELFNKFVARFYYDALNNRWRNIFVNDRFNDDDCANNYGILEIEKEKETLNLFSVNSQQSAQPILNYYTKKLANKFYKLFYILKHDLIYLEEGDVVRIYDIKLFDGYKKFIINEKTINGDYVIISVVNIENL